MYAQYTTTVLSPRIEKNKSDLGEFSSLLGEGMLGLRLAAALRLLFLCLQLRCCAAAALRLLFVLACATIVVLMA